MPASGSPRFSRTATPSTRAAASDSAWRARRRAARAGLPLREVDDAGAAPVRRPRRAARRRTSARRRRGGRRWRGRPARASAGAEPAAGAAGAAAGVSGMARNVDRRAAPAHRRPRRRSSGVDVPRLPQRASTRSRAAIAAADGAAARHSRPAAPRVAEASPRPLAPAARPAERARGHTQTRRHARRARRERDRHLVERPHESAAALGTPSLRSAGWRRAEGLRVCCAPRRAAASVATSAAQGEDALTRLERVAAGRHAAVQRRPSRRQGRVAARRARRRGGRESRDGASVSLGHGRGAGRRAGRPGRSGAGTWCAPARPGHGTRRGSEQHDNRTIPPQDERRVAGHPTGVWRIRRLKAVPGERIDRGGARRLPHLSRLPPHGAPGRTCSPSTALLLLFAVIAIGYPVGRLSVRAWLGVGRESCSPGWPSAVSTTPPLPRVVQQIGSVLFVYSVGAEQRTGLLRVVSVATACATRPWPGWPSARGAATSLLIGRLGGLTAEPTAGLFAAASPTRRRWPACSTCCAGVRGFPSDARRRWGVLALYPLRVLLPIVAIALVPRLVPRGDPRLGGAAVATSGGPSGRAGRIGGTGGGHGARHARRRGGPAARRPAARRRRTGAAWRVRRADGGRRARG
jgi:hypothetical protein